MDAFQTQFTVSDVTYTFRLPTSKEMIEIDRKALELRGGLSEGLGAAHLYSQSIAMLNTVCVDPKPIDFGELPPFVVDELSGEVAKWLNSFRKPVGTDKATDGN